MWPLADTVAGWQADSGGFDQVEESNLSRQIILQPDRFIQSRCLIENLHESIRMLTGRAKSSFDTGKIPDFQEPMS
jgi:hypothetical protein